MKIFAALHNPDMCDSAYATLSLHKTREGAEKSIAEHKALKQVEHAKMMEYRDAHPELGPWEHYDYDFNKDWIIDSYILQD